MVVPPGNDIWWCHMRLIYGGVTWVRHGMWWRHLGLTYSGDTWDFVTGITVNIIMLPLLRPKHIHVSKYASSDTNEKLFRCLDVILSQNM